MTIFQSHRLVGFRGIQKLPDAPFSVGYGTMKAIGGGTGFNSGKKGSLDVVASDAIAKACGTSLFIDVGYYAGEDPADWTDIPSYLARCKKEYVSCGSPEAIGSNHLPVYRAISKFDLHFLKDGIEYLIPDIWNVADQVTSYFCSNWRGRLGYDVVQNKYSMDGTNEISVYGYRNYPGAGTSQPVEFTLKYQRMSGLGGSDAAVTPPYVMEIFVGDDIVKPVSPDGYPTWFDYSLIRKLVESDYALDLSKFLPMEPNIKGCYFYPVFNALSSNAMLTASTVELDNAATQSNNRVDYIEATTLENTGDQDETFKTSDFVYTSTDTSTIQTDHNTTDKTKLEYKVGFKFACGFIFSAEEGEVSYTGGTEEVTVDKTSKIKTTTNTRVYTQAGQSIKLVPNEKIVLGLKFQRASVSGKYISKYVVPDSMGPVCRWVATDSDKFTTYEFLELGLNMRAVKDQLGIDLACVDYTNVNGKDQIVYTMVHPFVMDNGVSAEYIVQNAK